MNVHLPTHGGFAFYRLVTPADFYKVKAWGINKGESFDEALALLCLERLDGVNIPAPIFQSYDRLREFSLSLAPDDLGLYVSEVLKATCSYYANKR